MSSCARTDCFESYVAQLREAAQAVFDAAGNGPDALGDALVTLGLVLASSEGAAKEQRRSSE